MAPQERSANRTGRAYSRPAFILFCLLLAFTTTFHLWFIWSGHFDLSPDEAHYWSWSRRLDWSYYSKGPMVAYLIALSTRLGGDSEFFVRLPAVLLSAGTALMTFLLARRLYRSEQVGLDAVVLLAVMPLASAGSILMTIDAPLVFFWVLALLAIHRALEGERTAWWLAAGIALGLGLLSKYTMAVMVPQIALYLALSRGHRMWTRRPGPYVALGAGLLLFVPVLWWNAAHDWVSFRHLQGQIGGGKPGIFPLRSLLEFSASQMAVVTPVLFIMLLIGVWHVARAGLIRDGNDASLFLLCASAPLLLICTITSLWTKVQANWAAPAYVAAAIAAAGWRSESSSSAHGAGRHRRKRALFTTAVLTALLVSVVGHFPQSLASMGAPLPPKLDPTRRLRGWKELGQQVSQIYQEMSSMGPTFLFSESYQIASEVMFYVPGHPKTYNIRLGRRMNQFDVWGGMEEALGSDAIFVSALSGDLPSDLARSFESVRQEPPHSPSTLDKPRMTQSWSLFRCYGFRGFPPHEPHGY